MKSILEQFYYGNITPCETTVTDNRFQKIVSDIDSIESELLEQHPEIRKLLDQYRDKNGRLAGMEIETKDSDSVRCSWSMCSAEKNSWVNESFSQRSL